MGIIHSAERRKVIIHPCTTGLNIGNCAWLSSSTLVHENFPPRNSRGSHLKRERDLFWLGVVELEASGLGVSGSMLLWVWETIDKSLFLLFTLPL